MEGEQAVVHCDSTKGSFSMRFYRDWSPHGYDRAVEMFEKDFFDDSHFFRCIPDFLCQFGITYSTDPSVRDLMEKVIPDDPQLDPPIKFDVGVMSYAGSGPDSRSSQIFINYSAENTQLGENPWETPFGIVERGMDVVRSFYSYGDMPPWGKGPVQEKIYDGPQYINEGFPLLDKMKSCVVQRIQSDSDSHVKDSAARGEARSAEEDEENSDSKEDDAWQDEFEEGISLPEDLRRVYYVINVDCSPYLSLSDLPEEDDEFPDEDESLEAEELRKEEDSKQVNEERDLSANIGIKGAPTGPQHRHFKIGKHSVPLSPLTGVFALGSVVLVAVGILKFIGPKRKLAPKKN